MGAIDDVLDRLTALPENRRAELVEEVVDATSRMSWIPNPGPQTEAYLSLADILLYGGEPGGGKTQLLIGLAFNEQQYSLLMRRQYSDMEGGTGIIAQALALNHGRNGFNGSPPPKLTRPDGRIIDFGAAKLVGDEQHWQGKPHDFIGIDEGAQFAKLQIQFLMGWLRSDRPQQRQRVVIATNPPLTSEGMWLVEMFAPWIDENYPNPAKPGELRWFLLDEDDRVVWVNGPSDARAVKGKMISPKSATFIPAAVKDNPYLADTGYEQQLEAMPEVYKRVLLGKFKALMRDSPNQIIPTAWVRAAQDRWTEKPPRGIPMCAIAADASGGGDDPLIVGWRHDGWFSPFIEVPGKDIPVTRIGAFTAGVIISHRRGDAQIIIDMGGGYGGPAYEWLHANDIKADAYKGAEKTPRRTADKKLGFTNKRSAALWGFREALDPGQPGGSPIALPPDTYMVADLTATTFEVTPRGIEAESKEDVCARLGRSTDRGDCTVMCWWAGPRATTAMLDWMGRSDSSEQGSPSRGVRYPKVIMGRQHAARR